MSQRNPLVSGSALIFVKKACFPRNHCRVEPKAPGEKSARTLFYLFVTPNARRPGTAWRPRSLRRWGAGCVRSVVSGACCSECLRGKLFVSPFPGRGVCCVSAECERCCGSSSGRKPGRK